MRGLTVKMRIKIAYRNMTSKEKLIADYISNNINKISRSTISDISSELNLSDSTFFQFTRKLGFTGFKDFKISLLTEEFDPEISIHENITRNDNEATIAKKVFESSIKALEDTKKLIDGNRFRDASKIMLESNKVCFLGLGGSNAVAKDTYHKFLRSPINCLYVSDFHMQLMNASLLNENDCLFLVSHTGLSKQTIEIANIAKKNKSKIILITSYPLSPLAKLSDIVLVSTSEEIEYRSESLSSRLSQLAIVDSLFVIVMLNDEKKSNTRLSSIREVISTTRD